jgi:hypothetical protein
MVPAQGRMSAIWASAGGYEGDQQIRKEVEYDMGGRIVDVELME